MRFLDSGMNCAVHFDGSSIMCNWLEAQQYHAFNMVIEILFNVPSGMKSLALQHQEEMAQKLQNVQVQTYPCASHSNV